MRTQRLARHEIALLLEEEIEDPGVHTLRHSQGDRSGRSMDRARCTKRPPHFEGGTRCSQLVTVTTIRKQQRISPELHERASVRVGGFEETVERTSNHFGDSFGTFEAHAVEALRQPGEARDVRKADGSLQSPMPPVSVCGIQPAPDQQGHVRPEIRSGLLLRHRPSRVIAATREGVRSDALPVVWG